MVSKKRLAVYIVLILVFSILLAQYVIAGCCYGVPGCSTQFIPDACPALTTFTQEDCSDLLQCKVVICCHNEVGIPRSIYRHTCNQLGSNLEIKEYPFTTNIGQYEGEANLYCNLRVPRCQYVNCEAPNTQNCSCGLLTIDPTQNAYCCQQAGLGFPNQPACVQGSGGLCQAVTTKSISGSVKNQNNVGVAGALVAASAGPQVFTDENGNFTLPSLPSPSVGSISATKGDARNFTSYSLPGPGDGNIQGLIIRLFIPEVAEVREICDNNVDDNNNQNLGMYQGSQRIPFNMLDKCDAACGLVTATVTPQFYGVESLSANNCEDNYDNDCDGRMDISDPDCFVKQKACGDFVIDRPNTAGFFEVCDAEYENGVLINGSDEACPGNCQPDCSCIYKPKCGNDIIDINEECDGPWSDALGDWIEAPSHPDCIAPTDTVLGCRIRKLGCGNGEPDPGEQCDGNWFNPDYNCDARKGCNIDCSCTTIPVCGNGLVERRGGSFEDCDGTYASGQWSSFTTKKYGCTAETCGAPGESDECTCPSVCDVSPGGPILDQPNHVHYKREILLNWSDDCYSETAKTYDLFRCKAAGEGSTCNPFGGHVIGTRIVGLEFTDADFESETTYCYGVRGYYDTDSAVNTIDFGGESDNRRCITTGDEICYTLQDPEFGGFSAAIEFCDETVRMNCSPENKAETIFDCDNQLPLNELGYACLGPYGPGSVEGLGRTECVPVSKCDICNDPFGLFAFSHNIYGQTLVISRLFGTLGPEDCDEADVYCVLDYTKTSVDKFEDCGTSCYDFNSRSACDIANEKCGVPNCEWVNHPDFGELGIGVCRSTIIEEQECERCHDPLNKVFGICNRESCSLYGACYYDVFSGDQDEKVLYDEIWENYSKDRDGVDVNLLDGLTHFCTHKKYIDCEDFNNVNDADDPQAKKDCIGSDSIYSLSGTEIVENNVNISVSGNMYFADANTLVFNKSGGSNSVIKQSDDYFGFGKCMWGRNCEIREGDLECDAQEEPKEQGCIKNSDGNPEYTSSETTTSGQYEINILRLIPDCVFGSLFYADCKKDFTSPNTSLSTNDRVPGMFEIMASVDDNSWDYTFAALGNEGIYPTTYACLVKSTDPSCYPSMDSAAEFISEVVEGENRYYNKISWENVELAGLIDKNTRPVPTGDYVLYYFSEDVSKNLEVVQSMGLYIDSKAPGITVTYEPYQSWEVQNDEWRSNVTITMNVVPDENVFCSAALYLPGEGDSKIPIQEGNNITDEFNNSWSTFYPLLSDGLYNYEFDCYDDVGNHNVSIIPIKIEGDKSLTNSFPSYPPKQTFNTPNVKIGVTTGIPSVECKYERSIESIPAFESQSVWGSGMNPLWNSMDGSLTKLEDSNNYEKVVTAEPGFNRYYLKCKFTQDGEKYLGNLGDQVFFGVDTEGPLSYWKPKNNVEPYQGWYSDEITIDFVTFDPPIPGLGFNWEFGKNHTMFCKGYRCWNQGLYRIYDPSNPVKLNKSELISFYAVDKGGNIGEKHEDVQLNIDTEQADVDIKFYDGLEETDVLLIGIPYTIRLEILDDDKEFISDQVSEPFIFSKSGFARSLIASETITRADSKVYLITYEIDNRPSNYNKGEDMVDFVFEMQDQHGVITHPEASIFIDTNVPAAPVLQPSIEVSSPTADSAYESYGYPLNFHANIYFTNDSNLFITGHTAEQIDVVAVVNNEETPPFVQSTSARLRQQNAERGGGHKLVFAGDLTRGSEAINENDYLSFEIAGQTLDQQTGPRKAYGSFGKYFDIASVSVSGSGTEAVTEVTTIQPLNHVFNGELITFYDRELPSKWFGINLPLEPWETNFVYFKVADDSGNVGRYPALFPGPALIPIFVDPNPPKVISHYPRQGTTADVQPVISILIKEDRQGSQIDPGSLEFSINSVGKEQGIEPELYLINISEEIELEEGFVYYEIRFALDCPSDDPEDCNGNYTVNCNIKDYALNGLYQDPVINQQQSNWMFIIDTLAPAEPEFELVGGQKDPDGRWYVNQTPDFTLTFPDPDPVTIYDIYLPTARPTQGTAATCRPTETFNKFYCIFNDPKPTTMDNAWADYLIWIFAYKTLSDGTNSTVGWYEYDFTIDDEPPEFFPEYRHRIADNSDFRITSLILNEKWPLKARFQVPGIPEGSVDKYIDSTVANQFYTFTWAVPNYNTGDGVYNFTLTLEDYAGNKASYDGSFYLDLTAPLVETINIFISDSVDIDGERVTAKPIVIVNGTFRAEDDDIVAVWISPGDCDEFGQCTDQKPAELIRNDDNIAVGFQVATQLTGGMGEVQVNEKTLFIIDEAGHESRLPLRITKDLKPPGDPEFRLI